MDSSGVSCVVASSALDRAFASLVVRLACRHDNVRVVYHRELLNSTALLLSSECASGNSCLKLGDHAGHSVILDDREVNFPSLTEWKESLLASGVCGEAGHSYPCRSPVSLLTLDDDRLYLSRYHRSEVRLAEAILVRAAAISDSDTARSRRRFRELFPGSANEFPDCQALAAVAALRSSMVFITGGPGTGKTTVAARLLALLLDRDPSLSVALAAPTGLAATRLAQSVGATAINDRLHELDGLLPIEGCTLHRLLGYHSGTGRFSHDVDRPLQADVIIVDEASMVDVLMMDALCSALRPSARLIVLGDPDQLASVGTGFVLGDVARAAAASDAMDETRYSTGLLSACSLLTGRPLSALGSAREAGPLRDVVIRLQYSWRFSSRPGIGRLAEAVRAGRFNDAMAVLRDDSTAEVALHATPGSAAELLSPLRAQVDLYLQTRAPGDALNALAGFRILAALRDGPAGVAGLNVVVEKWLQQRGIAAEGWYDHRPVLITANDPSTQLYNGDVGVVLALGGTPMVHFPASDGALRSMSPFQLPAHETAWAMTIHKSQGSEFDHVVLVLPDVDNRILTRELLYTGVTRARQAVTIFGSPGIIASAAGRSVARVSGLLTRLKGQN